MVNSGCVRWVSTRRPLYTQSLQAYGWLLAWSGKSTSNNLASSRWPRLMIARFTSYTWNRADCWRYGSVTLNRRKRRFISFTSFKQRIHDFFVPSMHERALRWFEPKRSNVANKAVSFRLVPPTLIKLESHRSTLTMSYED